MRVGRSRRLLFRQEPVPGSSTTHFVPYLLLRSCKDSASREAHRFAVDSAMPVPSCPSSSSSPKLSRLRATRSQREAWLPAGLPSAVRPGPGCAARMPSALRSAEATSTARVRFPQGPAPLHSTCSPLLDRCNTPAPEERRSMTTPVPRRDLQYSRWSPAARLASAMTRWDCRQAGRTKRNKAADFPGLAFTQAGVMKGRVHYGDQVLQAGNFSIAAPSVAGSCLPICPAGFCPPAESILPASAVWQKRHTLPCGPEPWEIGP